jgi:hypothetical protein
MRRALTIFITLVILLAGVQPALGKNLLVIYPSFSITAVVADKTVTIKGVNFPANDKFTVTMGAYGTLGKGGTVVTTYDSGVGGSFTATFNIPAGMAGAAKIAIRLESPTSRYFAYNWFFNNSTAVVTPAPTPVPTPTGYKGYPVFGIVAVVADKTVTIKGTNFPANDKFTVTMGAYGTLGKGGTVVTTFDSGAGGTINATFNIPAGMAGAVKIAIRLESPTSHYYAYNWFYNATTN